MRSLINRALRSSGWELRRAPSTHWFGYDPWADAAQLIRRHIRGGPVVFDVGANVGQTIAEVRRVLPDAIMHAFEPDPDAATELAGRYAADSRLVLNPMAVGAAVGTLPLYRYENSAINSLHPRRFGGWKGDRKESQAAVPVTTLDLYCQTHGIESVAVLKLDIQGGELEALRGASALLERHGADMILTEVLFRELYVRQCGFEEVWTYLRERGYEPFSFYRMGLQDKCRLGWCDVLFVNRRVAEESLL